MRRAPERLHQSAHAFRPGYKSHRRSTPRPNRKRQYRFHRTMFRFQERACRSSVGFTFCHFYGYTRGPFFELTHADRKSPRKRAFRYRPETIQALVRESRHPFRGAPSRILREADCCSKAQSCRSGQTPPEEIAARIKAVRKVVLSRSLFQPRHG